MPHILTGRMDRRLLIGLSLLAVIAVGIWLVSRVTAGSAKDDRPVLLVMSSIPLQWGEATMTDIASGQAQPDPLFEALTERNRPVLVDDFQKLGKPGAAPLLMIQPRALAPRELVVLDNWVRDGGSVIFFADPALDWPSDLPLGDPARPLFTSLLRPLFQHWGLELALPVSNEGEAEKVRIGSYRLIAKARGIWLVSNKAKPSARCTIREDKFVAYCSVGKGRALLIADADVVHQDNWTDNLLSGGTIAWLNEVIAASRSKAPFGGQLWESQGN